MSSKQPSKKMSKMKIGISKINPLVDMCAVTGISLLVEGDHGIGKSEIVRDYAINKGYHCEIIMLSQYEQADLLGMPVNSEKDGRAFTDWSPPAFFERIYEANKSGKRSILFLDELNRAVPDVMQTGLQLILNKQLGPHVLPSDTIIIAAINPDDGIYQVNELDPALINRFMYISAEVDIEGWLNWARKNQLNTVVTDFIANNPSKLNDNQSATPRSWTHLSKVIDNINILPVELQITAIIGCVGLVGTEFYRFFSNYVKEIKYEDVLNMTKVLYAQEEDNPQAYEVCGTQLFDKIVHKMEGIYQVDMANKFMSDILKQASNVNSIKGDHLHSLFVYLYSLKLETVSSILKSWKENDETSDFFFKIMQFDPNKTLVRKARDRAIAA